MLCSFYDTRVSESTGGNEAEKYRGSHTKATPKIDKRLEITIHLILFKLLGWMPWVMQIKQEAASSRTEVSSVTSQTG